MKRLICIISIICVLLSMVSVTSFAWITRNDRYPESNVLPGMGGSNSAKFVDKGLPAPIVSDPVPHAVEDRINIKLNGNFEYFYNKPVLTNGRVFLPFRELFVFFDMRVAWEEETQTAVATNDTTEIKITVDNTSAYVNNEEKILDVPALLIDGRTYVPMRFVAESLGYTVGWDNRNQIVNIYTNGGVKK